MSGKNHDHFYVEQRDDCSFAATRGGGGRASYTGQTQGAVLDQLKEKQPGAPVHIERIAIRTKAIPTNGGDSLSKSLK